MKFEFFAEMKTYTMVLLMMTPCSLMDWYRGSRRSIFRSRVFDILQIAHCHNTQITIRSKMYVGLQVKYLSFLSVFNKTWIFSSDLRKTLKYQITRKSLYVTNAPTQITLWKTRNSVEIRTETVRHVSIHDGGGQSGFHNLKGKINQYQTLLVAKYDPVTNYSFHSF